MEITLRIFIILVSLVVFASVIYMLVRRNINESNSILWLLIGFFTLLFGFFPNIVNGIASIVGIDYPPSFLFLVSTIMLLLIAFKSSINISKHEEKINEIATTLSIVREENLYLKTKLEEMLYEDNTAREKGDEL